MGVAEKGVIKLVSHGSCTFQYCSPAAEPGEQKTNLNGDKSPGRSHPSILLTAVTGRDGFFGSFGKGPWRFFSVWSCNFYCPCAGGAPWVKFWGSAVRSCYKWVHSPQSEPCWAPHLCDSSARTAPHQPDFKLLFVFFPKEKFLPQLLSLRWCCTNTAASTQNIKRSRVWWRFS